jgi:hypothetical protein
MVKRTDQTVISVRSTFLRLGPAFFHGAFHGAFGPAGLLGLHRGPPSPAPPATRLRSWARPHFVCFAMLRLLLLLRAASSVRQAQVLLRGGDELIRLHDPRSERRRH